MTLAGAEAFPLLKTPISGAGFLYTQTIRAIGKVEQGKHTVSRFFPTFVEENPCIKAKPAGIRLFALDRDPEFLVVPVVSRRGDRPASRLARLRSRRSFSPVTY